MTPQALFAHNLAQHRGLFAELEALADEVAAAGECLAAALRGGGRLYLCGNGGSASDSLHLAAELNGRLAAERAPLPAVALCADVATLTAIGNDYGFEQVFARPLAALARPGDVLVALSTSGRSPNVLRALETARAQGVATVALLGRDGGPARTLADLAVVVPHADSARIQEAHIFIGHTWCGQIERTLGLVG
jgi:D-sedoheptulose 7-phosphate isomerase